MTRLRIWLCLLLAALAPAPSVVAAQVRADPGVVIGGKVVVRAIVTLSDESDPYFPVRDLRLRIGRLPDYTDTASVRTDATGIGDFLLASGEYQLTTDPVMWKGRRYAWDVRVVVRPDMRAVELTPGNSVGRVASAGRGEPGARPAGGAPSGTRPAAPADALPNDAASQTLRTSGRFFSGSIGYLRSDAEDGASVALGIGGLLRSRLIALLIPVDLAVVPNRDERYVTDSFQGRDDVCLDSRTGQSTSSSRCAPDIVYSAAAEAGVVVATGPAPLYVTGGYRFGDAETPYGAVTLAFQRLPGRHWYLRGSAGRDFLQLSLGGSLPW